MEQQFPESAYGFQVALKEARDALNGQLDGIDAMKGIARQILTSGSLIVALLGALRIFNASIAADYLWLYNVILVIAALLYLGMIGLCVYVLKPISVNRPVIVDWTVYYEAFITQMDDRDIDRKYLSSIVSAIENNRPIVNKLSTPTTLACYVLPAIVILILILGLLPRG